MNAQRIRLLLHGLKGLSLLFILALKWFSDFRLRHFPRTCIIVAILDEYRELRSCALPYFAGNGFGFIPFLGLLFVHHIFTEHEDAQT
jgi:hypothetical protein